MRRVPALVVTALVGLVLTACGGNGSTSSPAAPSTTSTSAPGANTEHNAADVSFAQTMIVHHRQAIDMAEMAATRASRPQVKQLAASIEKAQDPEIQTMSGWLTSWGEQVPTGGSMPGMAGPMPGMMSEADMKKLESLSGAAFAKEFLSMMVEHHRGAIQMAAEQQKNGKNPAAAALAKKIESDQTAEIATIQSLLAKS